MFDPSSIIVGLEIGTSKVCAVVGESNSSGNLNIIGIGQARSRGVRKGEITDAPGVEEDVRAALTEAEAMSNTEIRSVFLGVTGAHVRGFNNRGVHPIVSADREIGEDDVQDVVKNAKAINLPPDNCIIHAVRQHFHVDGQKGIINPIGMCGARLEVDVHVIQGNINRLQNPIRVVRALQLDVELPVFTGMASALSILGVEQKETGALVVDIGAGSTEYVVYADGIIKHTGALAVGGDHISNDLAYGLKLPLARAEQLKLEYGSALCDETLKGQVLTLGNDLGRPGKSINLEHLRKIMSLRVAEIFQLIGQDLERQELNDDLRAGVFICGGGARIPGVQYLAERAFNLPAYIGKTNSISGIKSALDQPEFATAIGLVKFGSMQQKRRDRSGFFGGGIKAVTELFRR